MASPQNEKLLLAEAAEHLVLARLLRLGYPASQAPRTWKADDILIDQGPSIQVKSTDKGLNWMVGLVARSDRQFYAFVDYRDRLAPVVYVMSNADVRKVIDDSHEAYKLARPHWRTDTGIRNIKNKWSPGCEPAAFPNGWLDHYRERWDQLPAPTKAVAPTTT